MKRIRTSATFDITKDLGTEKINGISKTVPNDSYTIAELLMKYSTGIMPPVFRSGFYEENPDFETIDETQLSDFDLADVTRIMEEIEDNEEHYQNLKNKHNAYVKKSKEEKRIRNEAQKLVSKKEKDEKGTSKSD